MATKVSLIWGLGEEVKTDQGLWMGVEKMEGVGLGGSTIRQKSKGQETAGSQEILGAGTWI